MEHPLLKELHAYASEERAQQTARFFKTGKGQYGEGDIFIGVTMPQIRSVAKRHREGKLEQIVPLLTHEVHEARMLAFLMLLNAYEEGDDERKKRIFDVLMDHLRGLNNWDLVDVIIPKTVGHFLVNNKPYQKKLEMWSVSPCIWERRIAMLATFPFIKMNDFSWTLKLSEIYLTDKEDLMHKATGWALREIGKHDLHTLRQFLDLHASHMPRTMLRYAIEKLEEKERKKYMEKKESST